MLLVSCTAVTVRPSYRPFPLAMADTVAAAPPAVIAAAADSLRAMGLDLRIVTPEEGYLETRWFDPGTRRSHGSNEHPTRLFRVRVWADLVTPLRTEVVVESAYRRMVDPSLPGRENERVAFGGTPGDSLARRLRQALAGRFGH